MVGLLKEARNGLFLKFTQIALIKEVKSVLSHVIITVDDVKCPILVAINNPSIQSKKI